MNHSKLSLSQNNAKFTPLLLSCAYSTTKERRRLSPLCLVVVVVVLAFSSSCADRGLYSSLCSRLFGNLDSHVCVLRTYNTAAKGKRERELFSNLFIAPSSCAVAHRYLFRWVTNLQRDRESKTSFFCIYTVVHFKLIKLIVLSSSQWSLGRNWWMSKFSLQKRWGWYVLYAFCL